MSATLVDSNVILDLLTRDEEWLDWSAAMLDMCAQSSMLVINPVIYAECSVYVDTLEELEQALPGTYFIRETIPWEAAFLAGKCFLQYRRLGGTKHNTLPDFFIGAHAAVRNLTLLTRDPRRFRSYFPKLQIICP